MIAVSFKSPIQSSSLTSFAENRPENPRTGSLRTVLGDVVDDVMVCARLCWGRSVDPCCSHLGHNLGHTGRGVDTLDAADAHPAYLLSSLLVLICRKGVFQLWFIIFLQESLAFTQTVNTIFAYWSNSHCIAGFMVLDSISSPPHNTCKQCPCMTGHTSNLKRQIDGHTFNKESPGMDKYGEAQQQ